VEREGAYRLIWGAGKDVFGVESWEAFEEKWLGEGPGPKLAVLEVKGIWRWPITPLKFI
jgi:hypothetical protein